jgi:acyl carrier protein
VTSTEIEQTVLRAMEQVNLARKPESRLVIAPDAPLFGGGSPLDSLGLVSLLIDIEEALQDRGHAMTLSDARAMSQTRSPFRDVPALVAYIQEGLQQTP